MNLYKISHHAYMTDCYPLDEEHLKISIRTGKDIVKVILESGDPYSAGISDHELEWSGEKSKMRLEAEEREYYLFSTVVKPTYKRLKYQFQIYDENTSVYLLEDGFYESRQELQKAKNMQRFLFPSLNAADVMKTPAWVENTVWYQIFPDRFKHGSSKKKRHEIAEWKYTEDSNYHTYYGGDINGITEKLPYLKELGINGIYLNPIFYSDSNHKYDTIDYGQIDPDFGTEEEFKNLVLHAHEYGIHVMIDAVFNHCATAFKPWQDVIKNGIHSPYYNWFFIKDTGYDTFAFVKDMPKLNTNFKPVCDYLIQMAKKWVTEYGIDGIRFDVGNEISHSFIKRMRQELKQCNPEVYLLGEIWNDASPWLMGDEYDAVMNYVFLSAVNRFFSNQAATGKDLMYDYYHCMSMYYEQVKRVNFLMLDSHDTMRLLEQCGGNEMELIQRLAFLMSMPGSPCIYYGTEIGMMGKGSKQNRKCMPWEEIEKGTYELLQTKVKELIHIRTHYPQMKSENILWQTEEDSRRLQYKKSMEGMLDITVYCNAETQNAWELPHIEMQNSVLFSYGYENNTLKPGATLITIQRKENL